MEHFKDIITLDLFSNGESRGISAIRTLIFLYVALGMSAINESHSGQLKDFVKNNRYIRHLFGFSVAYILTLDALKSNNQLKIVLFSAIVYIIFLLSTKMNLEWSIIVFTLLIIGFVYDNKATAEMNRINKDKNLKTKDIDDIKKTHDKIKGFMLMTIIIIVSIGAFNYYTTKKEQYGGGFDIDNFVFDYGRRTINKN